MSERFVRPEMHLCGRCSTRRVFSCVEAGDLISRHFKKLPIKSITYRQISTKRGDPPGWMEHIENSVISSKSILDPVALSITSNGFEIIEGNHRAWIAYHYRLTLPALVFMPVCGVCTEALFCDVANARTRSMGWLHHQQGF